VFKVAEGRAHHAHPFQQRADHVLYSSSAMLHVLRAALRHDSTFITLPALHWPTLLSPLLDQSGPFHLDSPSRWFPLWPDSPRRSVPMSKLSDGPTNPALPCGRPMSTNTQCRRSPSALCTRSHVTVDMDQFSGLNA
jgi:hypothetical protein